jgi:hypothetical protein
MFHAYLDESGIHANSGAAAVIAAVAMPAAWEKFESQWTAFVRDGESQIGTTAISAIAAKVMAHLRTAGGSKRKINFVSF